MSDKKKDFSTTVVELVKPLLLNTAGVLVGLIAHEYITGAKIGSVRWIEIVDQHDVHTGSGAVIDGDTYVYGKRPKPVIDSLKAKAIQHRLPTL